MDFQLVLQLPGESPEDFDRLVELEEGLVDMLGNAHVVDGHDFGSGTMNIFVHTDDPAAAFDTAKRALPADVLVKLRAAYRRLDGENYIVVWPQGWPGPFEIM